MIRKKLRKNLRNEKQEVKCAEATAMGDLTGSDCEDSQQPQTREKPCELITETQVKNY